MSKDSEITGVYSISQERSHCVLFFEVCHCRERIQNKEGDACRISLFVFVGTPLIL